MPHRIENRKAKVCPHGSKKIGFVWHYAQASEPASQPRAEILTALDCHEKYYVGRGVFGGGYGARFQLFRDKPFGPPLCAKIKMAVPAEIEIL